MTHRLNRFQRNAIIAIAVMAAFYLFLRFSPYPALTAFCGHSISTVILDRDGQVVQITSVDNAVTQGLRREYVPLKDMPSFVSDTFIAAEDKHFYHHIGIDPLAIFRAAYLDLRYKRIVSGASTITMQLARIIRNENDAMLAHNAANIAGGSFPRAKGTARRRTVTVKIMECIDALRLEARFNKRQILELYLNNVPFGFNTEGVASAARTFFSLPLQRITKEQCAILSAIPRRPALYVPQENGTPYTYPFNMPHYIRYLQSKDGSAMLERNAPLYGEENASSGQNAKYGGVKSASGIKRKASNKVQKAEDNTRPIIGRTPVIRLSASLRLQNMAQRLLFNEVNEHSHARITQGALLAIDTRTGEVLAWVGSIDFNNERAAGQVDGVTALERPGSAMKPFLYALALEKGYSPSSVLPDVPLEAGGDRVYVPQNFNNRYNGPVRLRIALASSLNVSAVYLLRELGMEQYRGSLHSLGFSSLDNPSVKDSLGLSLALGGAEVSLFEMVRAFSIFPRDGLLIPLTALPPESDERGINLTIQSNRSASSLRAPSPLPRLSHPNGGEAVFSPDTARLICSILSDASARAMGFGYAKTLTTPFPSIFKTGTANQYMSIAAFAATPLYTVGVWMGNFDGNTVQGITGSAIPAIVARQVLITLHEGEKEVPFAEPVAWTKCRVCALSGMAATAFCPDTVEEYEREAAPLASCTWHTADGVLYPPEYAKYLAMNKSNTAKLSSASSTLIDPLSPADGMRILSPMDGSVFFYDPALPNDRQMLTLMAAGGSGQWSVVLDGKEEALDGEKAALSAYKMYDGISSSNDGNFSAIDNSGGPSISLKLKLSKGMHTCTVRRGEERHTVSWEVR